MRMVALCHTEDPSVNLVSDSSQEQLGKSLNSDVCEAALPLFSVPISWNLQLRLHDPRIRVGLSSDITI